MLKRNALATITKLIENLANFDYQSDITHTDNMIIDNISYVEDTLESHKLDIIYPLTKASKYPFIINIHGGGFNLNSKDKIYRNHAIRLASDKFAVVNINFRLAVEANFPAQIKDVLSVLSFVVKNNELYNLDLNNVYMCGDSSGAYMTAMTACVLTNDILKDYYNFSLDIVLNAVALNCGMYDFTTFLGNDIKFFMKSGIVKTLFGTDEYQDLNVFLHSSVLEFVNKDFPPTYLCDTEKNSFLNEAIRLSDVLKQNEIPCKFTIYNKEYNLPHAFNIYGKFKETHDVLQETFEFFDTLIN